MSSEFKIKWKVSEESVPGGLSVGAHPKSYTKYKDMLFSLNEVRKIDDLCELRIPYYPDFSPFEYQREAVLRMLSRFRGKGIFADQVGLGKTVEVGMTVAEFAERDVVKSVLLLCPTRLVFQWQQEMADKFSTHFSAFAVKSLGEIMAHRKKAEGVNMYIMSFERACNTFLECKDFLKRDIAALSAKVNEDRFSPTKTIDYDKNVKKLERLKAIYNNATDELDDTCLKLFDRYYGADLGFNMLIVDEADALLSIDSGKELQIYKLSEHLSKIMPYRILLSATPIRRQLNDIYMLMKIVRPEQFSSREDFIANYCFNKERLSDFKEEEIGHLKGIIDQLFTRNRLSSKTVRQSLKPLTIEEALKLNYDNFSIPSLSALVRDAVWHGLAFGEDEEIKSILRAKAQQFGSIHADQPDYWVQYVYDVFISAINEHRPLIITDQKNLAFSQKLTELIRPYNGNDAKALKFILKNYVIPPKEGHIILYSVKEDDLKEAVAKRGERSLMDELGFGSLAEYDDGERIAGGKYAEFDDLILKLKGQKVVVFSNDDADRQRFIELAGCRALDAKQDKESESYFKFCSNDAQYADAVYFAVNGQEKGVNMQFCSNLIIANLSSDPNLVEQIVGRISRINQFKPMHIYVLAQKDSLQQHLYHFYNDILHLFSDWEGDNTFIIGGAVAAFLDSHPSIRAELVAQNKGKYTEDGEKMEISFAQVVSIIASKHFEDLNKGAAFGSLNKNALWRDLTLSVSANMQSFARLVQEFGDQEVVTAASDYDDI